MPKRGRPRLVSSKASGTKLFVDDLREVVRLTQAEGGKTLSDAIRELVHEALVNRRLGAIRRDQHETNFPHSTGQSASNELREIREMLEKLAAGASRPSSTLPVNSPLATTLLTEVLGFAIAAEMKTHLLLQNFLTGRGLNEEAIRKVIAEHEEKARKNTERIVAGLRLSSG